MKLENVNKKLIMSNKPKCGCGNTLDPKGFCDGSHNKK
jgi:CDGSH-type Zn-finger protein